MSDTTSLTTTTFDVPAKFGKREEIAAMKGRIASMIPGADGAPDYAVWTAAQLAVIHSLNPFNGDIYIMRTKQGYNAHIGVKGLRKMARRQSKYMTEFRDLSEDEVRSYIDQGEGVECTLYRLDVARECKELGIPYKPVVAIGLWKKGDNIPATWTAQHVAKKRAEINAIKEAFDVDFSTVDPADESETIRVIGKQIYEHDRDHSLMHRGDLNREDNGDVLFSSPEDVDIDWENIEPDGAHELMHDRPGTLVVSPDVKVYETTEDFEAAQRQNGNSQQPNISDNVSRTVTKPNVDMKQVKMDGAAAADDPILKDIAGLYPQWAEYFTAEERALIDRLRKQDEHFKRTLSDAQYNTLSGLIDEHADDIHGPVLSLIFGYPVNKSKRPKSNALIGELLRKRRGEDNPDFNQETHDAINSLAAKCISRIEQQKQPA